MPPKIEGIEEEDLKRLYAEGKSTAEIARAYRVNRTTIENRMNEYGIERRNTRIKTITINCLQCGKEISTSPSRLGRKKFCSHACSAKYNKNQEKINIPKEKLEDLYLKKFFSAEEIAKICNVSKPSILRQLRLKSIPIRMSGEGKKLKIWNGKLPSRETLEQMYNERKLSIQEIADSYDVSFAIIFNLFKKYNIPRRRCGAGEYGISKRRERTWKGNVPTKENLNVLYWEENLTIKEIADRFNVPPSTVQYLMDVYAVPRMDAHKASLRKCRIRPTKPEQRLIEIIKKYNLPYRYTGDGDVMIGRKNPDFFNTNGNKVVIEVFGVAFHSPLFTFRKNMPYHQMYEGTIEHYKKYGLKCIIFWDRDILRENAEQFVIETLKKEGE